MAKGASRARAKIIAYKCITYSIFLFLLGVMQVSFFTKINVLHATPDLLLGATLTLAMLEDHKTSCICGIVAGLFYHSLGGFSHPIYIVFSFFCAYVFWILSQNVLGKNYLSFLVLSALIYGAKAIFNIVDALLFSSTFNLFAVIGKIVIPEFISSMIFCTISYLIFMILTKIFNRKSRKEGTQK